MRSPDALTLDRHLTNAKGEEGRCSPPFCKSGVHRRPGSEQEVTPHSPPPVECELQHKSVERQVQPNRWRPLSKEIYAIHRSWWPGLADAEADRILDDHLKALTGSNPAARLEHIILSLKDEHAVGKVRQPGKLVEQRIEHANSRARAGKSTTQMPAQKPPPSNPGKPSAMSALATRSRVPMRTTSWRRCPDRTRKRCAASSARCAENGRGRTARTSPRSMWWMR